jgi:protoporphyrinogen oxidase
LEIAIIGTGISGLSIANLLKDKHTVTLFERESKPGGLIKCERVQDCLFHKVGGHVFNSKRKDVLDWFWSFFDQEREFVKATRNAKVFLDNKIIGYPIENNIYNFDKEIVKKIIHELLTLHEGVPMSPNDHSNFGSFLKNNFGETLYDIYFKPYNQKLWNVDLEMVSMEWLEGKLPMPNLHEIITSNITRAEERNMVHSTFYYPKKGGSQFIVDRLKQGLTIRVGQPVTTIHSKGGKTVVGENSYDKAIYCGDVRQLPEELKNVLRSNDVDVDYIENLKSNGTSNLFCETDDTDISWLYIPEGFTKAHRIIYTGNFSDTNNRGSLRKTCVVEFSGKVDVETMNEEIIKLPGNLTSIANNYEPNSYVIQDSRTRKEIHATKKILEQHGIYLLGRFAEWEYYNMDKAIEAAFTLAEKINSN